MSDTLDYHSIQLSPTIIVYLCNNLVHALLPQVHNIHVYQRSESMQKQISDRLEICMQPNSTSSCCSRLPFAEVVESSKHVHLRENKVSLIRAGGNLHFGSLIAALVLFIQLHA